MACFRYFVAHCRNNRRLVRSAYLSACLRSVFPLTSVQFQGIDKNSLAFFFFDMFACSQEDCLLLLPCLSSCPSGHVYHLSTQWMDFSEIWYWTLLYVVDRAACYDSWEMTNLTQNYFLCIYFNSVHVLSNLMLIVRRIKCINTTSGICHSVSVTVSCAGQKGTFRPAHETGFRICVIQPIA
jgi:hypothetical protein